MKRVFSFAFIGGAIMLMSFAPGTPGKGTKAGKTTMVAAKQTSYEVDKQLSKVNWVGKKITGKHNGTINISDGTILMEKDKLAGGRFTLDTRSIAVTDMDADGNAKLAGHLKNDDFFGVEKFPTATLNLTKIASHGDGKYDLTGDLTIKGITHPISFPATVTTEGKKVTATAKFNVDRTKYDIKYGSKKFFASIGDRAINDEFELEVVLTGNAK